MSHVLTLVASDFSLLDLQQPAAMALIAGGARIDGDEWLRPGHACDLFFSGLDGLEAERRVRQVVGHAPVDLAIQRVEGRRKKLLVADMESTVIKNEMLEELAEFVGLRQEVEEITRRAMNGELDFRAALDQRVALLRGLDLRVLEECLEAIRFDPGARILVATSRSAGVFTALVSGGFTFFASWVAERVGFETFRANQLVVEEGKLAGSVVEPILDKTSKVEALHDFCRRQGLTPADVVAVGDGANDLPMLQTAGLGVAYHGKPAVAAAAPYRIDHGDLSTLLYFQGYREQDLVGA